MSRELLVVEQPDFLDGGGLDAQAVLRSVYRRYGFRLQGGKASGGRNKRISLSGFTRRGNMLVFVFQPEP